jgi:hypothetical protein
LFSSQCSLAAHLNYQGILFKSKIVFYHDFASLIPFEEEMASSLDASLDDLIKAKAAARPAKGGKGKKSTLYLLSYCFAVEIWTSFGGATAAGGPVKNAPAKSASRGATAPYKATTKFEGECNNCGKPGHKAADCRSAPKAPKAAVVRGGQAKSAPAKNGGASNLLERLGGKASTGSNGTMVTVANLARDIVSKELAELFGTVGELISAKVIFQNGQSTGTAQIVFAQQSKVI